MKTRQVHRTRRPDQASTEDFALREVTLPALADGQVLVENLYMSVDPYMRQSMGDGKDLEPWPLDGPLNGPSIGRVIETRNRDFSAGDIVESMSGWQEHFVSGGGEFIPYLTPDDSLVIRRLEGGAEAKDYLGLLGIASQTAYYGLMCAAAPVPGGTIVISSGAGTVGSIGCQIARVNGMRVVTSAGSDEKVAWLKDELGVDVAFNYKTRPIPEALEAACPDGIDLVLENASPEHFCACLPLMKDCSTLLIAGFVSIYNTDGKIRNFSNFEYVLEKFLTIRCYPFMNYIDAYDRFVSDMLAWKADGRIFLKETMYEGLEAAPAALMTLFDGSSHGKPLV
ncbi:MAG: NADP-dependent oxidoreductase, partial [Gammaproteobacteria bacterium]|nr:NADP-dependent oxidoreductase [Gammaproteobacteria bacterium]